MPVVQQRPAQGQRPHEVAGLERHCSPPEGSQALMAAVEHTKPEDLTDTQDTPGLHQGLTMRCIETPSSLQRQQTT